MVAVHLAAAEEESVFDVPGTVGRRDAAEVADVADVVDLEEAPVAGGTESAAADNGFIGRVRHLPPIIPSGDQVIYIIGDCAAGKGIDRRIVKLGAERQVDMLDPSSCRLLPFHLCRKRMVLSVGGRHRVEVVYIGIGVVVVIVGMPVQKVQVLRDERIVEAEDVRVFRGGGRNLLLLGARKHQQREYNRYDPPGFHNILYPKYIGFP